MLQTIQLPAGVAHLDTGLADVDGNNLTHCDDFVLSWEMEEPTIITQKYVSLLSLYASTARLK